VFYVNATRVRDRVKALAGAAEPAPTAVVLDIGVNSELDITSAEVLIELTGTLRSAGVDFALAELHTSLLGTARASGFLDALGDDHVFHTIGQAVDELSLRGGVRVP